jgi:Bacterial PH domain
MRLSATIGADPSSSASRRVVLRHSSQCLVAVAIGTVVTVGLIYIGLRLWPSPIAALVGCAVGVALSVAELRSSVVVEDGGITVRNFGRKAFWPWSDIARFERTGMGSRPPAVFVVTTGGERVPLVALAGTHVQTARFREWSATQVVWLNDALRARRTGESTPSRPPRG